MRRRSSPWPRRRGRPASPSSGSPGAGAESILNRIIRPLPAAMAAPPQLHGFIHDGPRRLDECLAVFFRGPRSYSGEDMAEISLHSNLFVVEEVLALACRHGARPALPGEFTYRAFRNGKLDLLQAEAVNDLIRANSRAGSLMEFDNLEGRLSRDGRRRARRPAATRRPTSRRAIEFAEDQHLAVPRGRRRWRKRPPPWTGSSPPAASASADPGAAGGHRRPGQRRQVLPVQRPAAAGALDRLRPPGHHPRLSSRRPCAWTASPSASPTWPASAPPPATTSRTRACSAAWTRSPPPTPCCSWWTPRSRSRTCDGEIRACSAAKSACCWPTRATWPTPRPCSGIRAAFPQETVHLVSAKNGDNLEAVSDFLKGLLRDLPDAAGIVAVNLRQKGLLQKLPRRRSSASRGLQAQAPVPGELVAEEIRQALRRHRRADRGRSAPTTSCAACSPGSASANEDRRHRRRPRRHRGGLRRGPHGRRRRPADHAPGDHRPDVLQPLHRRHRQGAPGAGDRRSGRGHGARRRRHRHPFQGAEPQQGAGGAGHAHPERQGRLPPAS